MKWCASLAALLILGISATAWGQGYGGGRLVYSGYRLQDEAESVPPADEGVAPLPTPAPGTRVRRAEPTEAQMHEYQYYSGAMHDEYVPHCNMCVTGLWWRRPLLASSSCYRPWGGCAADCGCAPRSCSPGLLDRIYCQTQASMATVSCRVRGWNAAIWGGGCTSCGKPSAWGGCGCGSSNSEVWHDAGPHDPLMPRTAPPIPAEPHEAPGPAAEPESVPGPENRPARRQVPSTVVPSAAWKWTPIRSSF